MLSRCSAGKKLHKMKNIRFLRGGRLTCGHFSRIIVNMKSGQETKGTNRALRVLAALLLTALSVAAVWFIFSNSLRDADSPSSQSQTVTEGVQDAIGTIAPSSPVANAEGEDFARLHAFVRKCAHFLEFALLGALLLWTCRSYTPLKRFWFAPPCIAFLVAVFDEYIQNFSPGRGTAFTDVLIDTGGALAGTAFAIACLLVAGVIARRKKKRNALPLHTR